MAIEGNDPIELFRQALANDDAALFRQALEQYPEFKSKINDPVAGFDAPAITCARSPAMLDALVEAGADIDGKSQWWAGGFGLLHTASPNLCAYAIERGAVVDAHAAARLGLIDRLRELVSADPSVVRARGGDGQTPLHFASTASIADYLLDHGAEIDARDLDHESTPAQYMVRDRQEVLRCLIRRGCQTDILMAAALGDGGLVQKHLDADPECVRMRVSDEYFPMAGGRTGGTIYQWTLGWYVSAHQVAKAFGHDPIFELLLERSPGEVRLATACWLGDEGTVNSLLAARPDLAGQVSAADRRQVAHAARNNDLSAVRLMLRAGWPVNARGQHGATPLHWAAWHGHREMVELILKYDPPLEQTDADFNGTPLRWAIHGSENGWHKQSGDYAASAERLIQAGAKLPDKVGGTDPVKQVLRQHGVKE